MILWRRGLSFSSYVTTCILVMEILPGTRARYLADSISILLICTKLKVQKSQGLGKSFWKRNHHFITMDTHNYYQGSSSKNLLELSSYYTVLFLKIKNIEISQLFVQYYIDYTFDRLYIHILLRHWKNDCCIDHRYRHSINHTFIHQNRNKGPFTHSQSIWHHETHPPLWQTFVEMRQPLMRILGLTFAEK